MNWTGILKCKDCGAELNRAEHVPEGEKTRIAIAAPLVAGSCPNGCRSTFSDCNLNTTIEWVEER